MTREEQAAIDRLRIALHSARPQQVIWVNPDDLDILLHILDAPKSPPPTTEQIMADPRVQVLVEAGDVMAMALKGNYIVPRSADRWYAALATLETEP